jgi:hypothetical protein
LKNKLVIAVKQKIALVYANATTTKEALQDLPSAFRDAEIDHAMIELGCFCGSLDDLDEVLTQLDKHCDSWYNKPDLRATFAEDNPLKLNRQKTREFLRGAQTCSKDLREWVDLFRKFINAGGGKGLWSLPVAWQQVAAQNPNYQSVKKLVPAQQTELENKTTEFYQLASRLNDLSNARSESIDKMYSAIQEATSFRRGRR